MLVPFILDSTHLMPSLQCQVLNAKFEQFATAFKGYILFLKMCTLPIIEGLWSFLPTSAAIIPTAFCQCKTAVVQHHQQSTAFKVYALQLVTDVGSAESLVKVMNQN